MGRQGARPGQARRAAGGSTGGPPGEQAQSPAEFCLPGYSGRRVPGCGPPTGRDSGYRGGGGVGRGQMEKPRQPETGPTKGGADPGLSLLPSTFASHALGNSRALSSRQPALIHTHVGQGLCLTGSSGFFVGKASLGSHSASTGLGPCEWLGDPYQ